MGIGPRSAGGAAADDLRRDEVEDDVEGVVTGHLGRGVVPGDLEEAEGEPRRHGGTEGPTEGESRGKKRREAAARQTSRAPGAGGGLRTGAGSQGSGSARDRGETRADGPAVAGDNDPQLGPHLYGGAPVSVR